MTPEQKTGKEREMPNAHLMHIGCAVAIILIMFLDMILGITTPLTDFIPWAVRIGLCVFFLSFAFIFMYRSHKALFSETEHGPDHVITDGIFDQVRNPMYLGILLIHFGFIMLSMSLIALGAWIVVIIIYDRMASFEEKVLVEIFGEEYKKYQEKTSKWVPR